MNKNIFIMMLMLFVVVSCKSNTEEHYTEEQQNEYSSGLEKQEKSKLAAFGGKYYNKFATHDYMEFFTDRGKVFIDADDQTLMADFFIKGDDVIINHSVGFTARGKVTENTIDFPVISGGPWPVLEFIFRGTWTK